MVEVKKCLDTYALVEIARGNPKFAEYLTEDFIISDLTLAEFYGVLYREEGEGIASYWLKKLEPYSGQTYLELFIDAIKFRQEHKKADISFFDSVGYLFAIKQGCLFVTGDKAFEHFKQVEFRKK